MLQSRKVNQIMMASCCAPCVETCGSNIPQIRANDLLFPLLMVFSVRSSLSDDTVTDFVVELLRRCSPHICFQVWFCRRSACANIRCMMEWRMRTLKNCLSPSIQALREIKLHRRQNLFLNNFYLEVDKCWSKEVVCRLVKNPIFGHIFFTFSTR